MDFQAIRKEYESTGLDIGQFSGNPIDEFKTWMQQAQDQSPGKWFETNAMTLSTGDGKGGLSSRTVLLKDVRDDGFVFFTNYLSEKGQQLAENPNAALLFHWPYLGRQIRINGSVTKTERQVSVDYFHSRPRGSQIGAAVSSQSEVIDSRQTLQERADVMINDLEGEEVPCPEHWGGYLVSPTRIEFWQGRLDRLHDRINYTWDNLAKEWLISRLSP